MALRLVLELPDKVRVKFDGSQGIQAADFSRINSLKCGGVQIARMPESNTRVAGARKGDPVKGAVVFQYLGPITLRWETDEVVEQTVKKVKATKRKAITSKARKTAAPKEPAKRKSSRKRTED